jgi:hypothetical protein
LELFIVEKILFACGEYEFLSAINAHQYPVNEFHVFRLRKDSGTKQNSAHTGARERSIDPIPWFDPGPAERPRFARVHLDSAIGYAQVLCSLSQERSRNVRYATQTSPISSLFALRMEWGIADGTESTLVLIRTLT